MIIHRPQTTAEAVQIRYANPNTTVYFAGGTDDLRLGGAAGGKELIDINALGLNTIEEKNGKIIEKGTMCKMARGEMVRFMAERQIEDVQEIKKFDRLGYQFQEDISSDIEYVFERNCNMK